MSLDTPSSYGRAKAFYGLASAALDLLGGAHVRVTEPRELHGVAVGEVAELRVIGYADRVWFGRAILYHPRGTRDAILEQARAIIDVLVARRDLDAVPLLATLFDGHPDHRLRVSCAHALAALGDRECLAALDARWDDADDVIAKPR